MPKVRSNTYPILNLSALTAGYRLYHVRGLNPEQDEYFANRQGIIRQLSAELKNPVTIIERNNAPYLVVRADATPPKHLNAVRTPIVFDQTGELFKLDFTERTPENDAICTRFLDFAIQTPLYHDTGVWQPHAGAAFFPKTPRADLGGIHRFEGFKVRTVITPGGGLGLCVDATNTYVSSRPLPDNLTRDTFDRWRQTRAIYHFGHVWYEIRLGDLHDLDVWSYTFDVEGRRVPLISYLRSTCNTPHPEDLRDLPDNAAVVLYRDTRGMNKAAPAPLVYPIHGSEHPSVARAHTQSLLNPTERLQTIHRFTQRYLSILELGGTSLELGPRPLEIERKHFAVPDLRFGNNTVLSTRGTPGAVHTTLEKLGRQRLELLTRKGAGVVSTEPFWPHYHVFPKSTVDSYGPAFEHDLVKTVRNLHPGGGYAPTLVTYDDSGPRSLGNQGRAVLSAVNKHCKPGSQVLVMIHRLPDQRLRQEDQLAALVVQELRKEPLDIQTSTIHVDSSRDLYRFKHTDRGPIYESVLARRGKLSGYLRNVALNKVLLPNGNWPFVLETPLHADVILGLDVKHNTAGLIVVSNHGTRVRFFHKTSKQKEKLDARQTSSYVYDILKKEASESEEPIRTIVMHRDGRVFPTEIRGTQDALARLKADGHLPVGANLTVIEISKTEPVPMRLFDVTLKQGQKPRAVNPELGLYHVVNSQDAYLCATGRPLLTGPGTARPLHVRHITGPLGITDCLEDVYALTCLTWTRPEGCTRYPITTKLNDRVLFDAATEYDEDAMEWVDVLGEELV